MFGGVVAMRAVALLLIAATAATAATTATPATATTAASEQVTVQPNQQMFTTVDQLNAWILSNRHKFQQTADDLAENKIIKEQTVAIAGLQSSLVILGLANASLQKKLEQMLGRLEIAEAQISTLEESHQMQIAEQNQTNFQQSQDIEEIQKTNVTKCSVCQDPMSPPAGSVNFTTTSPNVMCTAADGSRLTPNQTDSSCPPITCGADGNMQAHNASEYKYFSSSLGCLLYTEEKLNLASARQLCADNGAALISVTSQQQLEQLEAIMADNKLEFFWLDLTRTSAGVWQWADGRQEALDSSNWRPGYPLAGDTVAYLWEDGAGTEIWATLPEGILPSICVF